MNKISFKVNLNKILEFLIALLIVLIIFSTNNILMAYTKHLSILITSLIVLKYFLSQRNTLLKLNILNSLFIFFLALILLNYFYASNFDNVSNYLIYLFLGLFIIFFQRNQIFYDYFIKVFKTVFFLFITSMFIEAFFPELFHLLFSFLSFGDVSIREITSEGAIAGLAFEKAYAAFLCNLGFGIYLARFILLNEKWKDGLFLVIILSALMMTGKRTLFIIPITTILIFVMLFSKNNKITKLASVLLIMSLIIIAVYVFVPSASLIIDRIINHEGDILSGRERFWEYAFEMYRQNPWIGRGFLSFNDFAYNQGFRYYGEVWNYQAHNVYIQVLGEMGIIGFTTFVALIVSTLIKSMSNAMKYKEIWSLFIFYWAMLFAIYSLTGNTLYYPCQVIVLFLVIHFIINYTTIRINSRNA